MLYLLVGTFSLFMLCSAHSRNCMTDIDLNEPQGVQSYEYEIPHAGEPGYWTTNMKTDSGNKTMAWNRNFYIFGKFADDSSQSRLTHTTITAGLYREKELIYKTVINCDTGTWENWILDRYSKLKMILHGDLDTSKTSCKDGEVFDLILKNDNFRLANWIFNAQALQHDVRLFDRKTNHFEDGKQQYKQGITRPLVKITSKYSVFSATRLVFKATGKAYFDRLVFGQCDAWPKNMDMQCQKVREWLHARSKANLTDYTLKDLEGTPDENFGHGLGVFGNNIPEFIPRCITEKYFDWMQAILHGDRNLPLILENPEDKRAYCCCIDMKTGQVFNNDPAKNCLFWPECIAQHWACSRSFDEAIGREIYEEGLQEEEDMDTGTV